MSLATHSPLSPSLPDAIMQVSTESEQNFSVSYLNRLLLALLTTARSGVLGLLSLQISGTYSSLVALL